MSHFVVMCFGEDWESNLERYQETLEGPYAEFEDETDGIVAEWENGTQERIQTPDGRLLWSWDEEFRIEGTFGLGTGTHKPPEEYPKVEVPTKELYPDIDTYASEYHGYAVEIDEYTGEKRYGYYYNPNAKWDWWLIGGRWSGYFKVKKGAEAVLGEPGVFNDEPQEGYADQLHKGDIDLKGMFKDAMDRAAKRYDEFIAVTKGLEVPPKWATVRDEMFPNDIEAAREFWHKHPWVKAVNEARLVGFLSDVHEIFYVGQKDAREWFIENAKCTCLVPFAFLTPDGEWVEKGEMGWFGVVTDEATDYDWSAKFLDYFESLPDDTLVTVVDCHI